MMFKNINNNYKTLYRNVILQHVNNISILLTLNPLRLTLSVGVSKYIEIHIGYQFSAFKDPMKKHQNTFCVNIVANDLNINNNNIPQTDIVNC